jgi:hypothetical protein
MAAIVTPSLVVAEFSAPVRRPCRDTAPVVRPCRETIRQLVASLAPSRSATERRDDRRFPFPYPVRIAPAENDLSETSEPAFTVIGKHLSETGLGFYHEQPLPFRRVNVWLGSRIGLEVGLLMDLSWCRFVGQGWYISGGRFIDAVNE